MEKVLGLLRLLCCPFSLNLAVSIELRLFLYFQLTFVAVHQIVWIVYWKVCGSYESCTFPVILSSMLLLASGLWTVFVTSSSKRVHPTEIQIFRKIGKKLKIQVNKIFVFISFGAVQMAFCACNLIFIRCCFWNSLSRHAVNYLRLQTINIFLFACGHLPFSIKVFESIACAIIFETWVTDYESAPTSCCSESPSHPPEPQEMFNIVIFHSFSITFMSYFCYGCFTPCYKMTVDTVTEYAKMATRLHKQEHQELELIHSLVPPKLAEEVMKTSESDASNNSVFRDFYVAKMDNVSILFADIVGFTRMSSNKTAESLVEILNDLFGRFDLICSDSGCEKISTLGDCYYCVSGCPEPRFDHAVCCVTMGLMVCRAIVQFDKDRNEEVDMRVGVHSGSVLCGLVGTRRFKFDVWSHDVTLANEMESSGKPGRVHVSDATYQLVSSDFRAEPGSDHPDLRCKNVLVEEYNAELQKYVIRHEVESNYMKTWFIVDDLDSKQRKKLETTDSKINSFAPSFRKMENKIEDIKIDDRDLFKYFSQMENLNFKRSCDGMEKENSCLKSVDHEECSGKELIRSVFEKSIFLLFVMLQLIFSSLRTDSKVLTIVWSLVYFLTVLVAVVVPLLKLSPLKHSACFRVLRDGLTSERLNLLEQMFHFCLISLSTILPITFYFSSKHYNINGDFVLQLIVVELFPFIMWKSSAVIRIMLLFPITVAIVSIITFTGHETQCANFNSSFHLQLNQSFLFNETGLNGIFTIECGNGCLITELVLSLISLLVLISFLNMSIDKVKKIRNNALISIEEVNRNSSEAKKKENWLLNNIVPSYVLKVLKEEGKYSRTIDDVGIIFAKVTNFDSFYDESFQGGIELLRVLNELIIDMEELFTEERFRDVEKIKTIGSCLMAASGLNVGETIVNEHGAPEHAHALLDFCLALLNKLTLFNSNMLSFEFTMAIGYNMGQVTCGVVGISKLLFDIWGDAVNVASRMYSTGVYGRVQLTEACYLQLKDRFNFEYRGEVFVKGKGDMRSYLLVDKIK